MHGNGHAIPRTPIAIDMWDTKSHPEAKVFLLSHFHADHIVGLNSAWQHPIYASPLTCKFLTQKLKIRPCLVKALEVGEDHLISLDAECQEMVTVTLFDANHCPGSVMFLLSGYFGDILYTGDFRFVPGILDGYQIPPIDVLYLDNTYCSPKCQFPTREDAVENILSQLSTCLVQSKRVFLGLDNLGKEDLLQRIAKERQCRIHVYPARRQLLEILNMSDILTGDKSNTRVFVVPTNQVSVRNVEQWNREMKTHAILATARFCGFNFRPFSKHSEIHMVPYSNHSSYSEIKEFVKLVRPSVIIPIVGKHTKGIFGTDISERSDMSVFKQFLRDTSCSEFAIPQTVQRIMSAPQDISASNGLSLLPSKKRKIARRATKVWRRPVTVSVRYVVSSDSETDSDPDAIHIESSNRSSVESISEFSSGEDLDEDPGEPEEVWELTCVTATGSRVVSVVK